MVGSPVTQEQLSATIDPVKIDIGEIKTSVAVIPAIAADLKRINGTTAENTTAITDLQRWKWTLMGAGGSIGTVSVMLGTVLGLVQLGVL